MEKVGRVFDPPSNTFCGWSGSETALLPFFVEKARVDDLPRPARAGRGAQIDDGPVRQLRRLQRVVAVAVGAEIDAAVEHDIALWVEWIRKHEDRRVVRRRVSLAAKRERLGVPLHR